MEVEILFPFLKHWNGEKWPLEEENGKYFPVIFEGVEGEFSVTIKDHIDNSRIENLIKLDDASYTLHSIEKWEHNFLILNFSLVSTNDDDPKNYDDIIPNLCCEGTTISGVHFTNREVDYSQLAEYSARLYMLSLNFTYFHYYRFGRGYTIVEKKYYGRIDKIPHISLEDFEGKEKFKFQEVTTEVVWNFLLYSGIIEDDHSKNNVGRAIIALSFLQADSNTMPINDLMIVMMALEALYARGNESISSQLSDKIRLFLGSDFVNKKMINNIYGIRSRYIHGDIDLSFPFVETDYYTDKLIELSDTFEYSYYILISTLIKIIVENRNELNFEYIISE